MRFNEVELLPDYNPSEKSKDPMLKGKGAEVKREIKYGDAVKLGNYMGHTIYQSEDVYSWGEVNTKFFAVDNATGLPMIFVSGWLTKKKGWMRFHIFLLQARSGNKLKANDFYRFLLLKLPLILVTDAQSYGGLKVWQKMAADPKLTVFGWKNGKPLNVDPRDDTETHATDIEAWDDPESQDVIGIKLLAHRRVK